MYRSIFMFYWFMYCIVLYGFSVFLDCYYFLLSNSFLAFKICHQGLLQDFNLCVIKLISLHLVYYNDCTRLFSTAAEFFFALMSNVKWLKNNNIFVHSIFVHLDPFVLCIILIIISYCNYIHISCLKKSTSLEKSLKII